MAYFDGPQATQQEDGTGNPFDKPLGPYEPPTLSKHKLAKPEGVLGGCKNGTTVGPDMSTCLTTSCQNEWS